MTDTKRPEDAFWPYWVEAARQQGFDPHIEAALFDKQRYCLNTDKIFYYAAYGSGYDIDEDAEGMDLYESKTGWLNSDGDPVPGNKLSADMRQKFVTAIRETLKAHARDKS